MKKPRTDLWSDKEKVVIKTNLDKSHAELAKLVGKSIGSVKGWMHRNQISRTRLGKYDPYEVDFIKANLNTMTFAEIGARLGRREGQIYQKSVSMGIYRKPEKTEVVCREDLTPEQKRERALKVNAGYLRLFGYKVA